MRYFAFSILVVMIYLFPHSGKAQTITIIPKWSAQAQFAGYYAADKQGFYKDEGLDVCIHHPATSENSSIFLKEGTAAVMNLSHAIMEQFKGERLVNVMQVLQESAHAIISHSPQNSIQSFTNQKVAVWNHLSQELLDRLTEYFDIQVEWIRNNSGINIFLSGAVDHCLIMSYNELLQLAEYGRKIDPACVMRLADYDYHLPEDGLYVTESFYKQHPEIVDKLAKASIRGWEWVNEHQEEALDIVMEEVKHHNVGTNRYHQRKMLEEILRLQINRQSGKRTFHLSREDFEYAVKLLTPKGESGVSVNYEDMVRQLQQ